MSPWDGTKTTEDGDGTVNADEQLTASEWNNHVTDGHFPSDKLNLGTDVNGDPVMTDPANGDQVVLRYDPGAGQWEIVNVDLALNSNDLTNVGAITIEQIGSERLYAGAFDGSDPDQRLDAALSAATDGDIIFLENALYDADRTISKLVLLLGTGLQQTPSGAGQGTTIGAAWTLDVGRSVVQRAVMNASASISLTGRFSKLIRVQGRASNSPITVSADDTLISQGESLDVTYESGTANGIIDTVTNGTVTDNGSNTVGDIA